MADISEAEAAAVLHEYPLNSLVLEPWFNGLYACLALLTVWALLFRAEPSPRNKIWLTIVIVMFTSATIHSAMTWGFLISAFTNHGAGPYVAIALTLNTIWYKALIDVCFCLNILIADLLFIWRCWVVWEYNWLVVILPILATVAGQVVAVISVVGQVALARDPEPTPVGEHFAEFTTPYEALSLTTSLLTTGLIAYRIFMVQRSCRRLGIDTKGRFGSYSRILEILVESAAIYSVNLIAFVILTARKDIRLSYPELIHPQISGIATTLIIFRVAIGQARPNDQWSTTPQTTPDVVFGTTSYAVTTTADTGRTAGHTTMNGSSQATLHKGRSRQLLETAPSFSMSVSSETSELGDKERSSSRTSPV